MKTYSAGQRVDSGYYWDRANWEFTLVPEKGGLLPGKAGQSFQRVPLVLLLLGAPLLGGAFVIFLPLAGFVMAVGFGVRKGVNALGALGRELAAGRPGS